MQGELLLAYLAITDCSQHCIPIRLSRLTNGKNSPLAATTTNQVFAFRGVHAVKISNVAAEYIATSTCIFPTIYRPLRLLCSLGNRATVSTMHPTPVGRVFVSR